MGKLGPLRRLGIAVTDTARGVRSDVGGFQDMLAGVIRKPSSSKQYLRRGWHHMSEAPEIGRRRQMREALKRQKAKKDPSKGTGHVGEMLKRDPARAAHYEKSLGRAKHLDETKKRPGIRGVAEDLSRRGWTGTGRVIPTRAMKYLPVGQKALFAGFAGSNLVDLAKKRDPYDPEAGKLERAGKALGSTAGWLAGAPLGITGWMLSDLAARQAGGAVGSVADTVAGTKPPKRQHVRYVPVPVYRDAMQKASGAEMPGKLLPRTPGIQALKPAVGKLNLDRGLSPSRSLNMVGNANKTVKTQVENV